MGWAQYAIVKVQNASTTENLLIKFSNKPAIWGWTYIPDPDDNEDRVQLALPTIEAHAIAPGAVYSYGHTGYRDNAEGVAADIELWAVRPDAGSAAYKICSVSYASPWGDDNNFAKVTWSGGGWQVTLDLDSKFSPTSGPLGAFTLTARQE